MRDVKEVIKNFGKIDILVNNAGILLTFDFGNPNYENWYRMVDVNIKGVLICSGVVSKEMIKEKGGKIINIVIDETKGSLDYVMTKKAADTISRGLARELAPHILVNSIAPGCIDSGWISELSKEKQEVLKKTIPLGRWGESEDVAKLAVFLASDDCRWMTGETILLDGGQYLASIAL